LRYKCEVNFPKKVPDGKESVYRDRLNEEFGVIESQGFSSYMLIVADYANWCNMNDIRIGTGRGSCGGSMIAYLIGIHKADPIKYGLVFERFHNLKKSVYPDVDMDFSKEGKPLVEQYIVNKYGTDSVAHISNFNTITPKVFVRDVARSCELGGSREAAVKLGNDIADVIPKDAKTISSAMENSPLFAEYAKKYPEFTKHQGIDGLVRASATHAAGIVIGKRPLVGLVPVRKDKDGTTSLELAKEDAEECGLVKMDILGLSTLDIMKKTEELIVQSGGTPPDWDKITEEYDEKTYDLISRGDTFCVFQFGTSAGTVDLCKKIKPKSIEDLALITTLARPASKEIREDFIKTREGRLHVSLIHKSLKNALDWTFGYPLYDESLLVLAKDVAGWDLAEADKLRKLTKEKGKNPAKAKKWEEEFVDGAIKNGISKDTANLIWQKIIIPYGKYSFNKSLLFSEKIGVYDKDGNFLCDKEIKDIEVGDFVKSRDERTKKNIFVEVNNKYDHGKLPIVEVELNSGEKVKCTINHKFRVEENGEMLPLWKIIEDKLTIIVDTAISSVDC
jgi:DNA polymerase-3 subunit alpha